MTKLKAPFPWFGGKSKIADKVWDALGDVGHYIEPFAGSIATLLLRPAHHLGKLETINDKDCYLANFWRALQYAPDEVAAYADRPVNECDLVAIHLWMVNEGEKRVQKLLSDPDYYDAQAAGWWIWGQCIWIGSGWCSENGPWVKGEDGLICDSRQLPHLGDAGRGINRQRPSLGRGYGINRRQQHLISYFRQLADRLRDIRVCCGDWGRIVTPGAMTHGNTVGIFLDPPYLGTVRSKDIYATDDHYVSIEVRDWAIANGDNPRLRIVLAGYEDEHVDFMPDSWRMFSYSASKAYGTSASVGINKGNDANRHKERLWSSPGCLCERTLFK